MTDTNTSGKQLHSSHSLFALFVNDALLKRALFSPKRHPLF
jgi:hypothetical protein